MEFVQPIRDLKQIETIKKLLKLKSLRDYCLFVLGINSGLRISDLLKLEILDIVENGKIKDRIRLRERKTKKFKDFPISDKTKSALKEYLKTREYKENEPLFLSRMHKGFLSRQQAYKVIKEVAKEVGIKDKIGTHTLRKTFGYHHYQKFKDVAVLQKIFNHYSSQVTLRYIGIDQDMIDNSYNNFIL